MSYHGDYAALGTVDFKFTSLSSGGSPFALANGTANVYQSNSTTESAAGITLTPNFDGRTGVNHVHIETGADISFYANGNDYQVILIVGQIAGIQVGGYLLGEFSIGNRAPLRPTIVGRTLDISTGGEAGLDWSNIGAPTTTVNLSNTTVKTATDVEAKLPTALVGGRMDSSVGAWQANAGTPLMPTVQGRTLDVTTTGEGGIDWNNIGAPTTTVNLSGTTIKTATDVETETLNIQTRLPTALTGGRMDSSVGAWQSSAGTPLMPTIQGRTLDVTATGEAGIDWANIGAPTITVNLSGTTIKTATDVAALLPTALIGGKMDSSVGAWQATAGTPLMPTVQGRTLDVTATGEGGIDWANIGAPTTTVNLSGTTVKTATDVAAQLPTSLVGGKMDSSVGAWQSSAGTPLMPTIQGRTLDVTVTGEGGIDWNNIGAPTTTVNLSGTTIKTATDVAAQLPTALVSGRMDSSVGAWQSGAGTPLMPTIQGRTLDVTVTGEAGVDWANIGAPTTTINLSGTTIKTATDVAAQLPTSLVGGRMDSSVGAWQAAAGTPLMPTVQGRTLDVTITGEGGVDWNNIGAPATTQNLSGTTVKTATDVAAQLPVSLVGGRMDSSVGAWQASAGTPLMPTVQGRTLDVTTTGEAGMDWNNIGAPTTTINLSGTTIKTATDVETETLNIQTRLPTSLTGGRMDSSVGAWGSGTPLMPTIFGRTLDVTATGEAGIDWGNIGNPSATVDLTNTTVASGAGLTSAQVRDAVWNAVRTNFGSASTFGEYTFAKIKGYENVGTPLQATIVNRTLDVTLTGEAGVDWANIGAPTTVVNLSGTTIKTATDIQADTDDIQTRLPAVLSGGRMDSIVNAWGSGTPLQPTIFGRTLDVTATGEAGIDWGNIGNPSATVDLLNTTVASGAGLTQAQVRDAVWSAARANFGSASTFGEHTFAKIKGYESVGTPLQATIMDRTLDVTLTGEAGVDWANIGAPTTTQNLSGTSTKALEPTVAGRTLDVTATGEGGIDWANIGAPTTIVNLSGTTVKAVTDALTIGTNNDKTGYALTSAERDAVANALLDLSNSIETSMTMRQAFRLIAAALGGILAGAATTSITIRSAVSDSKVRVTATVDADGNRTAFTYDLT